MLATSARRYRRTVLRDSPNSRAIVRIELPRPSSYRALILWITDHPFNVPPVRPKGRERSHLGGLAATTGDGSKLLAATGSD